SQATHAIATTPQERPGVAVGEIASTHHFPPVVDAVRGAVASAQGTQAAHAGAVAPKEGPSHVGAGANLAEADHLGPVVDASSPAARAAQGAETSHALTGAP